MPRYVMCLIAVLLLAPSTASAAFTSQVTSPAPGSRFLDDAANRPKIDFAGTADPTAGTIDLKCISSQGGAPGVGTTPIDSSVPVDPGTGAWSDSQVTWPSNGSSMCEVYAVPHGFIPATNADLNGMTGSRVYPAYFELEKTASSKAYDYYATMSAPQGFYDFESLGGCTLDYGQLLNMHEYDGSIFDCNAWIQDADPTDSSRSAMVVDGKPAFSTFYIGEDSGRAALPGWTGLTFNLSDDAGMWHLTSTEGIFRCANTDAFPPAGCTGWQSSGLHLDLDERQSTDGRTLTQVMRFVNEDNQPHTLSLALWDESVSPRQWSFPGTAGFQDYGLNATPSTIAPSVATIRNQINPPSPELITKGVGGMTYGVTPAAEQFVNPGDTFVQRYTNLTIPAGGALRLPFIYTMSATSAGLDSLVSAAESSFGAPPAITVTSPTTATAAAYTLTGTVNAPEKLSGLTINDQPVSVTSGGSFAMDETLAIGANAFTLKATDELGRTTTTPFSVTYTQPPANTAPASVVFGRSGKPKLKGRTLTTGATATCPGTGPACAINAAALVGRKKAGSGRATVQPGATVKLKVKLTKAGAKLFKRTHRLTLKLTGKRAGATTTTANQTVKLPAKKR